MCLSCSWLVLFVVAVPLLYVLCVFDVFCLFDVLCLLLCCVWRVIVLCLFMCV